MAFLVNEPVTQSDLNNIAVDLGDAEFSAFSSNKFGVDALNAITADLVTSGVLRTLDKCKPTLTNGNVNIAKGIIVFSDGAKLRITSPVSITAVANAYVAAKYDSANGTCSLVSVAEIPTETGVEYMKLAQVSSDGTTITDLRTMARSKSAGYEQSTENVFLDIRVNDIPHTGTTGTITLTDYPEIPENFNFKRIYNYNHYGRLYLHDIPDSDWITLDLSDQTDGGLGMRRTATGFEFRSLYYSTFERTNLLQFV
jgi:hypothetical protein